MGAETLRSTQAPRTPSWIARPLPACPACGSADLDPVADALFDEVNFLCRACSRCWRVGLGAVSRVSPATCMGCPERARCTEAYAAER